MLDASSTTHNDRDAATQSNLLGPQAEESNRFIGDIAQSSESNFLGPWEAGSNLFDSATLRFQLERHWRLVATLVCLAVMSVIGARGYQQAEQDTLAPQQMATTASGSPTDPYGNEFGHNGKRTTGKAASTTRTTFEDVFINFQDNATAVPHGWLADYGLRYAPRGYGYTYGWFCGDNPAYQSTTQARNRRTSGFSDIENTLVMPDRSSTCANEHWNFALHNGDYYVEVIIQDTHDAPTTQGCSLEGHSLNLGVVGMGKAGRFAKTISVSDGNLTFAGSWANQCSVINRLSIQAQAPDISDPYAMVGKQAESRRRQSHEPRRRYDPRRRNSPAPANSDPYAIVGKEVDSRRRHDSQRHHDPRRRNSPAEPRRRHEPRRRYDPRRRNSPAPASSDPYAIVGKEVDSRRRHDSGRRLDLRGRNSPAPANSNPYAMEGKKADS